MSRTKWRGRGVVLCGALGLCACAKNAHSAQAAGAARETRGEISQVEVLTARVEAVDPDARLITMKGEDGRPFVVDVGENVPLARFRPQDWVRVQYQESVAFSLQEPGEQAPEPAVEHTTRRVPDGVQFGRTIDALVEIVSVTPDGSHATFKVPEGMTRTVYVDDAPNQRKIARLKPGDEVAVRYTERLALAREN